MRLGYYASLRQMARASMGTDHFYNQSGCLKQQGSQLARGKSQCSFNVETLKKFAAIHGASDNEQFNLKIALGMSSL